MSVLDLVLVLAVVVLAAAVGGHSSAPDVLVVPARLNARYDNATSSSRELRFLFDVTSESSSSSAPRAVTVSVECHDCHLDPREAMVFVVRLGVEIISWHLPVLAQDDVFYEVQRTVLLAEEDTIDVLVSTSAETDKAFSLTVSEQNDFILPAANDRDQSYLVRDVAVWSPTFKYVSLDEVSAGSVMRLRVTSEEADVCAVVSLQDARMPVHDTEHSVRAEGMHQTMLKLASFSFYREEFPSGLLIVLVVSHSDEFCGQQREVGLPSSNRTKSFTLEILEPIPKSRFLLEIGVSVTVVAVICIAVVVLTCACSRLEERQAANRLLTSTSSRQYSEEAAGGRQEQFSSLLMTNPASTPSQDSRDTGFSECGDSMTISCDGSSTRKGSVGKCACYCQMAASASASGSGSTSSASRLRGVPKFVSQLSRVELSPKEARGLFLRSELYIRLVAMMGIFYSIPAVQLVLSYQDQMIKSGNQDFCYYNSLCSLPVAAIRDFNHIFSNVCFLGLGGTFLLLTWMKKREHRRRMALLRRTTGVAEAATAFGVSRHFGISYAMGLAMIFQGVLSACYHVCPTEESFQFDTTFMYVIGTLCFVRLYQFRHPDAVASACKVFLGMGFVLLLEAVGIFNDSAVFWLVAMSVYFVLSLALTLVLYCAGRSSFNVTSLSRMLSSATRVSKWKSCSSLTSSKHFSTKRLVLVLLLNALNTGLVIFGALWHPHVSDLLLATFVTNLLIYFFYYVFMKIYHREALTPSACLYFVLCLLSFAAAFFFYFSIPYATSRSPAQSRNMNEECVITDLYDTHDVWHMLSATGTFFAYMLLMTLDDGLFNVARSQIHVF